MEKCNVLHLVSNLSINSGVMSIIINVMRRKDKNIVFDFMYFDESEFNFKDEIQALGGKTHKIQRPSVNGIFISEVRQLLQSKNYNIVHNHELYLNWIIFPIVKSSSSAKVIVHSHTTKYSDKILSAIRNYFCYLPLRYQADYYVSCSKAAGNFAFGKSIVDSNKFRILYNAIDLELFRFNIDTRTKLRSKLNIDNKYVIGHIGRFNKQKNHNYLIDIFNEVSKLSDEYYLVLIGDGKLKNNVIERVEKLQLSNKVLFLSNRNDINELLQAFDCFILPSLYEGLPIVGIEAQSSGLKCIFSSKITKEVGIVNSQFIEINNVEKWVEEIVGNNKNFERKDEVFIMTENRYNINLEYKNFISLYIECSKKI